MTPDENDPTRSLYADQRKQYLLETLRRNGRIDANDIAAELNVTGETIRKDLIALERQGLLRRVHGGAVPVAYLSYEPAVETRTGFATEKARIAKAALQYVPQRGTVLIDAGSTTAQLVEIFPGDRELTVYTNTLPLALSLLTRPLLTVFTLGGRVRTTTLAEVDDWAARALAEINVDVAFLGANGISVHRGLTTPDPAEAAVKRRMLACAQRRILLADHSKVGVVSGVQYGHLHDIDLLITDTDLPDEQRHRTARRRNHFGASMILTLTPNPSVDRTVFLDTLTLGSVNRSTRSRSEPSGKGINVALALLSHGKAVRAVPPRRSPAPARRVTRARGRRSVSPFSGFATFVALLVTDLISDGISIEVRRSISPRGTS